MLVLDGITTMWECQVSNVWRFFLQHLLTNLMGGDKMESSNRVRDSTMDTSKFNICVTAEMDEISVRGNAVASGDDAYDKEVEDRIIEAVKGGNVWAWASVTVTVSPKDPEFCDLEESDYLGCCSYNSKRDFIENSGYYEDMVSGCISRLEVAMGGAK